jgi:hypothetical protein
MLRYQHCEHSDGTLVLPGMSRKNELLRSVRKRPDSTRELGITGAAAVYAM